MSDESTDPKGGYEDIALSNATHQEELVASWSLSNGIRLMISDAEVDDISHFHFKSDAQIEELCAKLLSFVKRKRAGGWYD